ncbi:MAG: response regulator, partial [Candidatus Zixiibacteriota bacterium]
NPGVMIETTLDPGVGSIFGSAPHLSKVIMNLVVNAFDAMHGGGTLTVKTSQTCLDRLLGGFDKIIPGDYLLLRVGDTGIGIAPEHINRIFEPYYSKKKMGASGSGLGLAVVYGIVRDHKGYYDIFSVPGRGTEFVLYLPVCKTPTTAQTWIADVITGSEKVLIVDDISEQRQLASELLVSLGYTVWTAGNAGEALAVLSEQLVDIVVLDMIMGSGPDGLETYEEMLKVRPGQRAIIVSGFSATERVYKMQELGAGQYVKKPYTRESLGRAVRAELDAEHAPSTRSGNGIK